VTLCLWVLGVAKHNCLAITKFVCYKCFSVLKFHFVSSQSLGYNCNCACHKLSSACMDWIQSVYTRFIRLVYIYFLYIGCLAFGIRLNNFFVNI
jgi:hypothetical protein